MAFLAWMLAACIPSGCSDEGWTRVDNGVVGTGNSGRVSVNVRPEEQDSWRNGLVVLNQFTDSLPVQVDSCAMNLKSACTFDSLDVSKVYRTELWISGRPTGRSGWFHPVKSVTLRLSLDLHDPCAIKFRFQTTDGSRIDSVFLGSRRMPALFQDSSWNAEDLPDSSDVVWVHLVGTGKGWQRGSLAYNGASPALSGSGVWSGTASLPLVLNSTNAPWADAAIQGIIGASGSGYDNSVYGTDTVGGLAGAWDASTVGRSLWKVNFPSSLAGRSVRSARLIWKPAYWGIRPVGGQDFILQGYRLLRPWSEGSAGYGAPNSALINGATALAASWGVPWNRPLIGLDNVDAESTPVLQDTLPYASLTPFRMDATTAVAGWLANPASNQGLVFRDLNEASGSYLDYPGFWMHEASEPLNRPRLVVELGP